MALEGWYGLLVQAMPRYNRTPGVIDQVFEPTPDQPYYTIRKRAMTTAIRYPGTDPKFHFADSYVQIKQSELGAIRSPSLLCDMVATRAGFCFALLKKEIHDAGLAILQWDWFGNGIPSIEFENHLYGSGI